VAFSITIDAYSILRLVGHLTRALPFCTSPLDREPRERDERHESDRAPFVLFAPFRPSWSKWLSIAVDRPMAISVSNDQLLSGFDTTATIVYQILNPKAGREAVTLEGNKSTA
jgi:hypothetical protein